MKNMTDIIDYIYSIPKFTKKGGLEQTARIMALFGHPENKIPYVHIAGTNGKGSVSAYLSGMLRACNLKVGMFTSPHLVRINERMQINGEEISDGAFIRIFFAVKSKIDTWIRNGGVHPTFFEFIYLMAMLWFEENKVDIAVVETGLGGRLDATNVVEHPLMTVITSIGLDHMQYLGDTVEKIAGEKAGIIKNNVPVIIDATSDENAVKVLRQRAEVLNDDIIEVRYAQLSQLSFDQKKVNYNIDSLYMDRTINVHLNTPAIYQSINSALALRAIEKLHEIWMPLQKKQLDLDAFYEKMETSISKTQWAGRFECTGENVYIDGAHNEAGIEALCKSIEQSFTDAPVNLLFAVAEDKDYTGMIRRLCRLRGLARVMVTAIENERRTSVDLVKKIFSQNCNGLVCGTYNIKEALGEAVKWTSDGGRLFCTGSLYLVGSLKELQKNE